MYKKIYLVLPVLIVLLFTGTVLSAQQKPARAGATAKRPNVKSYLGKTTGIIFMNAEQAKQVVALPITVVDDKNASYVISSYQFAYKRIGITEDEETGKTSPQSDLVADRFTVTPLPAVWTQNVTEALHKGEELYFFDIIIFDKQGRRFFAPDLKITIQ